MYNNTPYIADNNRFMAYYASQAGSGLPGYAGSASQYGYGLGGIFRNLFRFAMPLLKTGYTMAKPHLKTAVRNLAGDVIARVMDKPPRPYPNNYHQEGSGLIMHHSRGVKRPPGSSLKGRVLKRTRTYKPQALNTTAKHKQGPKKISRNTSRDIF